MADEGDGAAYFRRGCCHGQRGEVFRFYTEYGYVLEDICRDDFEDGVGFAIGEPESEGCFAKGAGDDVHVGDDQSVCRGYPGGGDAASMPGVALVALEHRAEYSYGVFELVVAGMRTVCLDGGTNDFFPIGGFRLIAESGSRWDFTAFDSEIHVSFEVDGNRGFINDELFLLCVLGKGERDTGKGKKEQEDG